MGFTVRELVRKVIELLPDCEEFPQVMWGENPGIPVGGPISAPDLEHYANAPRHFKWAKNRDVAEQALASRPSLLICDPWEWEAIEIPKETTLLTHDNPRLLFALACAAMDYVSTDIPDGCTDGFGWVRDRSGKLHRMPHLKGAKIGADCHIAPTACIARGALTDTYIGDGVKIDNMVHIAHGAHIGSHTSIAALSCIEGSVHIGERCTIGSGVTFQIGSSCGDDVTVGSGSVVTKHIPSGEVWAGVPARKIK